MDPIDYNQHSDNELVALSLENTDHFYGLMKRYEKKLLHYILSISNISRETAEDLLQEVFIKTYKNLNSFNPKLKFSSWVYRIAHNHVISWFRKTKVRPQTVNIEDQDLVNLLKSSLDVRKGFEQEEVIDKVREVLALLPDKYREALVLRYIEDLDYQEMSDILKKPMGTIATLLSRAKKKFKALALQHNLDQLFS